MATVYRIRTDEGAVYGPAGREEVERWIREGRVGGGMEIAAEGSGEFCRVSEHADFAGMIRELGDVPRPTHVPGEEGESVSMEAGGEGKGAGVRAYSGHAIAAMGLALAGFFVCPVVPAMIAIPLAWKARRMCEEKNLGGRGLATAALVLACVALPAGLACTGVTAWALVR